MQADLGGGWEEAGFGSERDGGSGAAEVGDGGARIRAAGSRAGVMDPVAVRVASERDVIDLPAVLILICDGGRGE